MEYWKDKRVAVTGGAGMVGSHLVELLIAQEAEVVVVDDFSRGKTYVPGARYIRADAGELGPCRHAFAAAEVVFNLAAYVAGVLYNQQHHAEMFYQNIRLQTVPAITAAECHVPIFVQASSVCVYAPGHNSPASVDAGHAGDPTLANIGYSWSKRMGEHVAQWAGSERTIIVRPTNIFGPRDYFDERAHVIPALIKKCINDDTIKVHGSGHERREFIYVEDVARGLLAAAEHGQHGGIYNLGTHGHTCISIRGLLGLIQEATNTVDKQIEFTGGDAGDDARWTDCTLTHTDLKWEHQIGLGEGIARTVEWYERNV